VSGGEAASVWALWACAAGWSQSGGLPFRVRAEQGLAVVAAEQEREPVQVQDGYMVTALLVRLVAQAWLSLPPLLLLTSSASEPPGVSGDFARTRRGDSGKS
jgi:hypothetical protein